MTLEPATGPRENERLLLVDPARGSFRPSRVADLARALEPGDLLVLNDAATLPAALRGSVRGEFVEARLLGPPDGALARVLLLGEGDSRARTEERGAPPALRSGDELIFPDLRATVLEARGRAAKVRFDREGSALLRALYRAGKPVQYAHIKGELALWDVASAFASRPWAVEMPSAGRPLSVGTLLDVRRRGVAIGALTHAAGLSSTGDASFDRELPLDERYEIGPALVHATREAARVIAVGTTVVRALEASHEAHGALMAERGSARLRIGPGFVPKVASGVLTGLHEPGTSHFELLSAFAPRALLEDATRWAARAGWLGHEFGDAMLVLASRACS